MRRFQKKQIIKLILIAVFAVAMGYLEATVVYYLRLLPPVQNSFNLPAIPSFPVQILFIEQLREAATIIMLVMVALLSAKNAFQRLFVFVFAFGIWDLIYYLSLYFLANWPTSLQQLDVVFLIPIQWLVPVYIPVILFTILTCITGYKILQSKKD